MSTLTIAKKDFQDAVRAKSLWALSALFVLAVGGIAWLFSSSNFVGAGQQATTLGFVVFLQGIAGTFVSIAGLVVAHKAISGERESGSLKILLGLPHSRRDVVFGKILGRSLVLTVAIVLGFLAAAVVMVVRFADLDFAKYALFGLLTVAYGFVFVTIAVGISSLTGSSSRSAALAIGFWILNQAWGALSLGVLFVVSGFTIPSPPWPDWYAAFQGLSPGAAYGNAATYFLSEEARQITEQFGGLPEWYGVVVLAAWMVLVLVFGYARFERVDL
ncbi:MAG: ABC transporter permease subunit [Halobacteriaceae archaeon]